MNNRKRYIDYMRAFAIILVIIGHANTFNGDLKNWIYSFHMPLFFLITGLTMKTKSIDIKLIDSKIRNLIIPYIIWGMIYMELSEINIAKLLYGSYQLISSAGSLTSLWFLPTLFLAYFISQFILRRNNKILSGIIGVLIIGLLLPEIKQGYPWCINVAFIAAFFILVGFFTKGYTNKELGSGLLTLLIVLGLLLSLTYMFDSLNTESYVLMATGRVGNPLVFLISSLGGILFIFAVSKLLELKFSNIKILEYLGQNTMAIFFVHKPIVWTLEKIVVLFSMPELISLFVVCLIVIAVSAICVYFINRYIPAVVGRY